MEHKGYINLHKDYVEHWVECRGCGKQYNPLTFKIKVGNKGPYRSWGLCQECAVKDSDIAQIVEEG